MPIQTFLQENLTFLWCRICTEIWWMSWFRSSQRSINRDCCRHSTSLHHPPCSFVSLDRTRPPSGQILMCFWTMLEVFCVWDSICEWMFWNLNNQGFWILLNSILFVCLVFFLVISHITEYFKEYLDFDNSESELFYFSLFFWIL